MIHSARMAPPARRIAPQQHQPSRSFPLQWLLLCLAVVAGTAAPGLGQSPEPIAPAPLFLSADVECCDAVCGPPGRVWVRGESLVWWTKGQPLPPLLTTSPLGTPLTNAGVLGVPGTTVLFGGSQADSEARSGGRFTLGSWLNDSNTLGVEANFFFLENESAAFSAASPGIPILARPFFDVSRNQPNALLIAFPGAVQGSFNATTSGTFFGGDVYLRRNICCGCKGRVDALAGYRYLYLNEKLRINEVEISIDPNGPAPVGTRFDLTDSFEGKNQFHGGEIGILAECWRGRLFAQVVGKIAVGATSNTVTISGSTRAFGAQAVPGGFLALPTNSGRFSGTSLAFVPEVGISVGYQITDRLRASVGYSFLYWSDVARPGNQVDLVINPTQPPIGNGLVGPARPAFNRRDSDFWAQGAHFGLEFCY